MLNWSSSEQFLNLPVYFIMLDKILISLITNLLQSITNCSLLATSRGYSHPAGILLGQRRPLSFSKSNLRCKSCSRILLNFFKASLSALLKKLIFDSNVLKSKNRQILHMMWAGILLIFAEFKITILSSPSKGAVVFFDLLRLTNEESGKCVWNSISSLVTCIFENLSRFSHVRNILFFV